MQELLNAVCDIGEQMLISGAEVHRVEDSVVRMCTAVGAARADVFIITSSMIVTVYTEEKGTYTQTRRIIGTGTDMEKLHRLNDLCRRICENGMSAAEIRDGYNKAVSVKAYPLWLEFAAYALIGGAFAVFFGGNAAEGITAAVIGAVLRLVCLLSDTIGAGRIFGRFICSFTASALAYLSFKLSVVPQVDNVIIGNIMVLIPGIGLTNALRDLFVGDSIAGLLRIIEAVLIALAIAAGHFLFITLMGVAA